MKIASLYNRRYASKGFSIQANTCVRSQGSVLKSLGSAGWTAPKARARGGASVSRFARTFPVGNSSLMRLTGTPRTSGFEGLLTVKSYRGPPSWLRPCPHPLGESLLEGIIQQRRKDGGLVHHILTTKSR